MSSTGILSLPTEVLDEVYGYLDWDPTKSLSPQREDIHSISLACRRLRDTAVPALFRTVTLRLRFVDGTLATPGVYRLRRQSPDLAKHVRCVVIRPDYKTIETPLTHQTFHGSQSEIERQWELVQQRYQHAESNQPFVLSGDVLDPASFVFMHFGLGDHRKYLADRAVEALDRTNAALASWGKHGNLRWSSNVQALHLAKLFERQQFSKSIALELARRQREDQINGNLSKKIPETLNVDAAYVQQQRASPSEVQSFPMDRDSRKYVAMLQARQEALALAIACIPTGVDHIFLLDTESTISSKYEVEQSLAIHLFAEAMQLFGPQLRTITKPSYRDIVREDRSGRELPCREAYYLIKAAVSNLSALQTLRIGGDRLGDEKFRDWINWQSVTNAITTRLELWGQRCDIEDLVEVLEKFSNLKYLLLSNLTVILSHLNPIGVRALPQFAGKSSMIHVAFELRQKVPVARLRLRNVKTCVHSADAMIASTPSEERFVESEVLDVCGSLDESRKEGLLRDYESFLSLWAAEEADCMDRAAQANCFARLADEAMSSRFQF